MPEIEKEQYQHNGSGSAILMDKKYNHIQARKLFNDAKHVTSIVINDNKTRWIDLGWNY